ncbi:MAG: acetylxylan esterase, partial [Armatimonadetes bacterium]|nr:acetylxylan esterase [Armatimonadota bacterium]
MESKRLEAWRSLTTPAAVAARQSWVRETVQRMIGPFPARCDLDPRVTGGFDRADYRVELVIFDSRPGFPVTATLYVPRGDGPFPAVVVPCGHSANGRMVEGYQRAHIGFVKQGFVVLAYDPISQGERIQYLDDAGQPTIGNCCHEHCMAGNQLALTGGSMANIRIWDGIRAHDYLLTRGEVDPQRVAVAGNSGGGTLSTFLLCLDERYAAGSPNCYITTLVHRIATRMAADSEQQFVPMLLEGIDHADLLLPAAPKPVQIGAALRDFFPIDGTRRTTADLQRVYEVLGAGDKMTIATTDNVHGWDKTLREAATMWFNRHLRGVDEPYEEPDFPVEDDPTLFATRTGQVLTSVPGALGIHEIVKRDAPPKLACRAAADPVAATR